MVIAPPQRVLFTMLETFDGMERIDIRRTLGGCRESEVLSSSTRKCVRDDADKDVAEERMLNQRIITRMRIVPLWSSVTVATERDVLVYFLSTSHSTFP